MTKHGFLLYLLLLVMAGARARDLRGDTIDICSYNLKLDLSDFTTKMLRGDATIGIKARKNGVSGIRLDLLKLTVDSVKVNSFTTIYDYNDSLLDVNLLTTLNTGDSAAVQVFYHGNPYRAPGDFGGFYWTGTYAFNIGVSFIEDPHNYGRVWFPCFDNFEERSLFEFYVTTKSNHKAFCNGLLLGVTSNAGKKTWHWKLGQEIQSYLASVAVSDYATVSDTVIGLNGVVPVELAASAADTTVMKNLFVNLPNAFHIQEELWGPYQWDRVGYCIVPFTAGAMEHATNIAMMIHYLTAYADQAETTMAHELSHHWFGDLVTCDSASEMCLNEGWARYNEHLFLERQYSDSVYKQTVRENHEHVLHDAHVSDGSYLPVSGVPSENTYGTTVYDKGADVIHTLRHYMGDSLFFHCMKNFVIDFAWKNMNTAQLRDYLSQCSGINLNHYFNDWVYSPGFAHFSIERITTFLSEVPPDIFTGHNVVIRQRLNHSPAFYNHVPATLTYFSRGSFNVGWVRHDYPVELNGECSLYSALDPFMEEVLFIALDFDDNLQDAITAEWKVIRTSGSYDFGTAKMIINATTIGDSSLVRVEHNWIRPEPMRTKIAGLHLHDKRYWTIDGIIDPSFVANAVIAYDRNDITLDSTFITNREDSMVVMYRADSDSVWTMASSFSVNVQGNANDGIGQATINNLKKGQYCLAIWNSALPDTTTADADCVFSSIPALAPQADFQLFPNPANDAVALSFGKNIFTKAEVYDSAGRKYAEQKIGAEQTSLELKLKGLANGTYIITLSDKGDRKASKKLIKQ